jgi:hypothetical protein
MTWWQNIGGPGAPRPPAGSGRGPRPGPSVYDGRYEATGPVVVVMTRTGQFLGVERDGHFEPAQPCCADPLKCERSECWTTLEGARGP